MACGHVQTGGWRRRGDDIPDGPASPAAAIDHAFLHATGDAREIGLDGHDGQDRRDRRRLGIEHVATPIRIESDRRVVVGQCRRDEDVLVTGPGSTMRGDKRYISSSIAAFACSAIDSSLMPFSLAIWRSACPPFAARKVWNWSLCSRYGDASSWAFRYARNAAFLSPFATIFASASGRFDKEASEAAAGTPPSGSVTGARSVQPSTAASMATARIRCNMSPPG